MQSDWVFLLKTTWMSLFKLICMMTESFTVCLISCIFDQLFHRCTNNPIYKLKQKCRTLKGVASVFYLLLYSQRIK